MSSVNIGVLISGGGTNLQSIIDNIENGNIKGDIKLILSNRQDAYGLIRGKKAGIETLFLDRSLFSSDEEYNAEIIKEFKSRDIDLVVLAGYLKVLSKNFIEEFNMKIINIHPSLIPSFCGKGFYGKKIHKAVLDSGVKVTGATVHFVDVGTDTGPIILQDVVQVADEDNVDTLQAKVLKVEHRLLVKAVKLYCEDKIQVQGRKTIMR